MVAVMLDDVVVHVDQDSGRERRGELVVAWPGPLSSLSNKFDGSAAGTSVAFCDAQDQAGKGRLPVAKSQLRA